MSDKTNNDKLQKEHLYYSIILSILVVLSFGIFVDTYAQDVGRRPSSLEKSVEVLNSPPFIESISLSNHEQSYEIRNFIPTENMNGFLYVYGTADDANGCQDILNKSNWNLAIYRSSVEGGDACNSNPLSCYHGIAESQLTLNNCDGNGDTHLNYQWRIPLAHYIDATDTGKFANDDWKVEMKVVDDASGSYTSHSYFEVATLRAVSVVDDIEYGSLGAGSESIEKKLLITNTGNDPIDLNVRADGPMICEKGEIPAENIHVGFVEGFDYGKPEIAMKKEDQYLNVSIPKRIGNEVSQKTIYLKLLAPVNGVHGRCMNSITFTAVQDK